MVLDWPRQRQVNGAISFSAPSLNKLNGNANQIRKNAFAVGTQRRHYSGEARGIW